MAAVKKGPQPALTCNITWCQGILAGSARKDGKRVVLPSQQSWTTAAVSQGELLSATPIDVHLYVRGGPWILQFAGKLVGEAGGNRHLSSIYVTGELRDKGEAEYRARLEAKGWTLPIGFQCDEWVLYQRQGDKIIIKLSYSRSPPLDGVTVFLEAALSDSNVWWSLPVLVNTGMEPVFGKPVISGIYSPAIEGQEIAIGVANRGADNVAVMPCIDGRNLLKAPYFLWAGDGKRKDLNAGGSSFATFPGLQMAVAKNKREKTEVTYKTLKFQKTLAADAHSGVVDPEQGMLKVRIFRTRKVILRSDPDRALEQLDQMWRTISSAAVPKSMGPLRLRAGSKELQHFDQHVASTTDEVKHTMCSMEMSSEAHHQIGEVAINYRSLMWFREAAAAKHRAPPSPISNPPPRKALPSSPPSTPPAAGYHLKSPANEDSPDSITPLELRKSVSSNRHTDAYADSVPGEDLEPAGRRQARQRSKSFDLGSADSTGEPGQGHEKTPKAQSPDSSPVRPALEKSKPSSSSPGGRKAASSSDVYERLSQPKAVRSSPETNESFSASLRSSSRSRERPHAVETYRREREKSPAPSLSRLRDKSPAPPSPRTRGRSAAPDAARVRDKSPAAPQYRLRDKSPAPPPSRNPEKSPAPPSPRTQDRSPAAATTRGRGRSQQQQHRDSEPRQSEKSTGSRRGAGEEKGEANGTKAEVKPIAEPVVFWIMPRIQGRAEALQKDEIVLRSDVRNVANLRRQVKLDLSPLLDEWSTAELVVMAGETAFAPETLLDSLPAGTGSASNPIIIEALDKAET